MHRMRVMLYFVYSESGMYVCAQYYVLSKLVIFETDYLSSISKSPENQIWQSLLLKYLGWVADITFQYLPEVINLYCN